MGVGGDEVRRLQAPDRRKSSSHARVRVARGVSHQVGRDGAAQVRELRDDAHHEQVAESLV